MELSLLIKAIQTGESCRANRRIVTDLINNGTICYILTLHIPGMFEGYVYSTADCVSLPKIKDWIQRGGWIDYIDS